MNHREKVSSEETELAALLPSPEDVERYRQTGYYISKKLYSTDELDSAIAASERYYAGLTEREIALPNNRTYPQPGIQGTALTACVRMISQLVVPELDALSYAKEFSVSSPHFYAAMMCASGMINSSTNHPQMTMHRKASDGIPTMVIGARAAPIAC